MGVAPGLSYVIWLFDGAWTYAPGYYSSSAPGHFTADGELATNLAVGTSSLTGISVTLPLPVHVTGTVTGPGAIPVADVGVQVCPAHYGWCSATLTAADGSYSALAAPGAPVEMYFYPSSPYTSG